MIATIATIAALALTLPADILGNWAPDREACVGRRIIDQDGTDLGRDDPIERVTITERRWSEFEAEGRVLDVNSTGNVHMVGLIMRGEGEQWESTLLIERRGDELVVDDLEDDEPSKRLVRC